jgi:uncharacterized protein (TIGR02145 family)
MEDPAMKMMVHFLLTLSVLVLLRYEVPAQVVDFDGNVYDTVTIGTQVWLKQNLKTTHYRNGLPIPAVSDSATWTILTTGARCYYENDSATFDSVYGALYNWYAVNDNNELCPEGWHVATDAEWTNLGIFLGGEMVAGGKMKEAGTAHWLSPNAGATNSSGFTGLPGGMRGLTSVYQYLTENGLWWASTQQSSANAWSRYLWYMNTGLDQNPAPKYAGFSIRCIRDVNVGTGSEPSENGLMLYPNPARDKLFIGCTGISRLQVDLYNVSGKLVLATTTGSSRTEIDIRSLPAGLYIVIITGDNINLRYKMVKE